MSNIVSFSKFLSQTSNESESLEEDLITLGGNRYPNFNTILILQGGAGSGKDFILDKLIGIEGKVLNVDDLKKLVIKSEALAGKIKEETGIDIKRMDLRNPDNVSTLHRVINDLFKLKDKSMDTFFRAVAAADPKRKPNVIFNVTAKSIKQFDEVRTFAKNFGYKSEDIHVVWVLDDVKAAIKKNLKRDRVVPEDILIETHQGAAITSKKLLSMGRNISKYMDGDYWLVFNKIFVDSEVVRSDINVEGKVLKSRSKSKGHFIRDAQFFKLKEQNSAPSINKLKETILGKIRQYVPEISLWN